MEINNDEKKIECKEIKSIEDKNVDNALKENDGEKKKTKAGNIVLIVILLICVIGLSYLIFKRLTTKEIVDLKSLPAVQVTHIEKGSIDKESPFRGDILPNDTYYVVSKVDGDIEEIYVKNGDKVKKGDPICKIDTSKQKEAAFISYDTAKSTYERMEKLYEAGDISKQSFESVKAQYDSAKLQYDTIVEYSIPVAVGDGVIENTDMIKNTAIKKEKVLCYITSTDSKEINFGVSERVLQGIKVGDSVKIEKIGDDKIYDGYISNIEKLINTSTGQFNVKAVITTPNNFASGSKATVRVVYERKRNINVLPNDTIYYESATPFIYIVNDKNVIEKMYISVGIEDENYTEILTDVDENTRIVSSWNNDLAEGVEVNVVNASDKENSTEAK